MIKKEYINPEMVVVMIATQMMLATSPDPDTSGGDYNPGDPVLSPGLDDTNMFGF